MADDKKAGEVVEKRKSSKTPLIIAIVLVVVVPAALAGALFVGVIRPLLQDEQEVKPEVPTDLIPPTHAMAKFDEVNLPILPDDPESAAPLLSYQVAFACSDPETLAIIENHKEWFVAKISEIHQNKTRSELVDPYVKNTLKKQIRQDANTLIKRLAPEAKGEVIEVLYLRYGIMDL